MEQENYKLETNCGDWYEAVAAQALAMAYKIRPRKVEFDFNDITSVVSIKTDLKLLNRDYGNAFMMGWKVIGDECLETYTDDILRDIDKKEKEREQRQNELKEKYRKEAKDKQAIADKELEGVELKCSNPELLQNQIEINTAPYGKCVVDFAILWGKFMQVQIEAGKPLADIADECSTKADIGGITGFMYGCAVQILTSCWVYGEDLRKWHNKSYGHDGDGVVNPAVLTIK